MSTFKEFILTEKQVKRRLPSEIQQKLKVVMNCYTIKNFVLGENNTFTFQKSHKIHGIRIDDPKTLSGDFILSEPINGNYKIRITVN